MLFRESFLNSKDNIILSTGNARMSDKSLSVECSLPYSLGSYGPSKQDSNNTGKYKVVLLNEQDKKEMGFLERKGDGVSRFFIQDCNLNLNKFNKINITLNDKLVLCGRFRIPSGFY